MITRNIARLSSVLIAFSLVGCINMPTDTDTKRQVDKALSQVDQIRESKNYSIVDMPYSDKTPMPAEDVAEKWLRNKVFTLNRNVEDSRGVSLKAILSQFNKEGINITTTLPVDQYFYRGYPITDGTDAYTALQILTEQIGLDFSINNDTLGSPYVSIIEMGTDTYQLPIPNVEAGMTITGGQNSSQGGQGGSGGEQRASGSIQTSGTGGSQGSGSGSQSSGFNKTGSASSYMSFTSNFWKDIKSQLDDLMTVVVPIMQNQKNATSNLDRQRYADVVQSKELFQEIRVGRVVINPNSGHITITAPKHVRNRVIGYLKDIDEEINTRIVINAKIIAVTTSMEESQGIDIDGFKNFASDEWGVGLSNNVVGNVSTVMPPENFFSQVADSAIASPLIGVQNQANMLFSAFNAYLSKFGETSSVDDINGSVRSNRTYHFSSISTDPQRLSSSNESTNSTGVTSGGIQSETVNNETGTDAKITPKYDARRNVINALLDIQVILDKGDKVVSDPISSNGTIEVISRILKRTNTITVQTEAPIRAGEMVIIGGMQTVKQSDDKSGVTGTEDTFFGGVTGKANRVESVTKYYVLLTMNPVSYYDDYER